MSMIKAAQRHEFDVLVITEVRALSRTGAGEVFIIYDTLKKCGVRLETSSGKTFENTTMGQMILGFDATYAAMERETSHIRMERGKADRIEIGKAPPNGHRCYGYVLVDTAKEVKGRYEFNHAIIYVDENDIKWSEYKVCLLIFDLLKQGASLHGTAKRLNDMGIPPPLQPKKREPHWTATKIQRIVQNPIYVGEVWCNRYKRVGKRLIERPKEEWILLPEGTAPALIDRETLDEIIKNLSYHKQDSIRNNKHEELGLLRAGYIFCGVCGHRMSIHYPSPQALKNGNTPRYRCHKCEGGDLSVIHNHRTQIHVPLIDKEAKVKIAEVLQHPEMVRAKVAQLREENAPVIDTSAVEETIENIRRAMQNIYHLAEQATDDETIANLTQRMNNLEKQKRDAESLLYDMADEEEERAELEKELVKFEAWAERVRPHLTNPSYMATASYKELRLAIRILGLRVTVYPTVGDWPYRYHIEVTVPEIMKKLNIVSQPNHKW